jgi:hypothetical protein
MEALGESYASCIAVLKLSISYGLSDPKFVATLGGMMFLNGDFSDAREMFSNSQKREFPAGEATRIHYQPTSPADRTRPLEFTGKVSAVKAGFAFVNVPGYPSFFCPGSKFGDLVMRQGLAIKFEVGFNAKGGIASNIREVSNG